MENEFDVVVAEMIQWLIDHPDVTLEEIGLNPEYTETPFGTVIIIKSSLNVN